MSKLDIKNSGFSWLEGVPSHWATPPVYARFEVLLGKMLDAKRITGKYLRPYLRNIDVQWDSINTTDLPEMDFDESDRRRLALAPGDLLLCEGGEPGRTAIWDGELPECYYQKAIHRLRPLSDNDDPRFFYWVMRTAVGFGVFSAEENSATIEHLPAEKLRLFRYPSPPPKEQRRIAGYLDEATGKIDRLLGLRRRQMELLQEQRAALIQQAVTRGLNPNAPLKPSGLQWLGDVPKHWEVIRLGRLAGLQGGYAFDSRDFGDEGVPVVRMNNLKRGHLDLTESAKVPSEKTLARFALRDGDILFGMSGSIGETGSLGNFASVSAANLPLQLNQRVGRFVLHHRKFTLEFLRLLMQSNVLAEQILQFVTGTAQFNISSQQVENVVIAVPPANEQIEIAKLVRHQEAKLDNLHLAYTRQLELLAEYRAALIHEYVTGQRVVPGSEDQLAAGIP